MFTITLTLNKSVFNSNLHLQSLLHWMLNINPHIYIPSELKINLILQCNHSVNELVNNGNNGTALTNNSFNIIVILEIKI